MTQTAFFGTDDPVGAAALGAFNNSELSFLNVQRKRLQKFAGQYMVLPPAAVPLLRSQGEPDITIPEVVSTREGFTQLRRDLPVLDQYYEYSGEPAVLAKVKEVCLAWARTNEPDGKPINESNFEWLVRVMHRRRADFTGPEWGDVAVWLARLRAAKEGFGFETNPNEGTVQHGNWYTHHYKVLLLTLRALDDGAAANALLLQIDDFAARNFPWGNPALTHPMGHTVVGANVAGRRFDIPGDQRSRFGVGGTFRVFNNTKGNDRRYTVASLSYLSSSAKTRIVTMEALAGEGGGGTLVEPFAGQDMQRGAADPGESIDYIRRDALHYHVYTLWPWIEIGLLTGDRYRTRIDAAWNFFLARLLSSTKHYEFAQTSDTFDGVRWAASHPEYLAPEAMFKPQRAAGMMLSYFHYAAQRDPTFVELQPLVALVLRGTDTLASFWAPYFRWLFGYGGNA